MADPDFRSAFNERHSPISRKILRILSVNSRAKIRDIAKSTGVSRRTAAIRLESMEREMGLSYTLDLDEEKLGLTRPHLILVKFNSTPDYSYIRELLHKSHIPQLAASISGTYDMLIYANAFSGIEYAHWDKSMQTLLSRFKAEWHASEVVHRQLGFFPLRNEALRRATVSERHRKMLVALNSDSRMRFQDLSKELGMNVNTASYNFNKLKELKYIRSFTAVMRKPADVSLMTFFAKYTPSQGYEAASAQARECFRSDDPTPLISRYLITAPLIGSYDFFTLGAFDSFDTAYRRDVLQHRETFRKFDVRMVYGEVGEVLVGKLPIRSVDTRKGYNTVIWNAEV